jgi:hypothetical protein
VGKSFVFNGTQWESLTPDSSGLSVDLIANVTVPITAPAPIIDGVQPVDGMWILLAKQKDYTENGVYVVYGGFLQILPNALIDVGTIIVATEGEKLKGANYTCFYMGAEKWAPGVETSWHDMQYLTNVAAITKVAVKYVSLTNISGAWGPQGLRVVIGTVPVTLTPGDRVLLVGETNASYNGIWNAATGIWPRAEDMSGIGDLMVGTTVTAMDGYLKKTQWSCGQIGITPWRPGVTSKWFSDTSLSYSTGDLLFSITSLSHTVVHMLGTKDVAVQVYNVYTGETIAVDVERIDGRSLTVTIVPESLRPGETVTARVMVTSTYDRT